MAFSTVREGEYVFGLSILLAYECVLTYGLLDGLLIPEELHGHHRLHVLVQLIHERNS